MPVRLLTLVYLAAALPAAPQALRVEAAISGFSGRVVLYARNLDTGADFGVQPDERVRTASTIKLAVMAAVFDAVARGQAKWEEELVLRERDKISGSGVLREFSDGVKLPVRDALHLMIVVSDNTATNLLLDRFPADTVNAYMDRLGLRQTRCLRKVMNTGEPSGVSAAGKMADNQRFGLGVTTPREMVRLLEMLEKGQVVSPAASAEMLAVLARQQYKDGIGRHAVGRVASKSGALDRLRSDVGIVYAKSGRIAMAITCDDMAATDWSQDNPGLLLISRLANILVDDLNARKP